jgi:hypothetical protein
MDSHKGERFVDNTLYLNFINTNKVIIFVFQILLFPNLILGDRGSLTLPKSSQTKASYVLIFIYLFCFSKISIPNLLNFGNLSFVLGSVLPLITHCCQSGCHLRPGWCQVLQFKTDKQFICTVVYTGLCIVCAPQVLTKTISLGGFCSDQTFQKIRCPHFQF